MLCKFVGFREVVIVLFLLCSRGSVLAGTCECKPEIPNASAVVTSTCSKIWSNNQCTLKESGASSMTAIEVTKAWDAKAYPAPRPGGVDPRQVLWPAGDWQYFYSNLRPRIIDIGYLERLILVTLQTEVPPEFARNVVEVLRQNKDGVISAWTQTEVRTFSGHNVRVSISKFYIYGEGYNSNFYINARP